MRRVWGVLMSLLSGIFCRRVRFCILQEGSFLRTENGEDTVETDEVCLRVETPFERPMSSACSRFKEAFLDSYAHNLLFGSDAVFEYDYHGRLFDWGCGLCDASGEVHCDQVRYIVEKLRASPESVVSSG